jgi:hypothetical protein
MTYTLQQAMDLLDQVDAAAAQFATSNPGRYGQYLSVGSTNRMVVDYLFTETPYTGNAVNPGGDQTA